MQPKRRPLPRLLLLVLLSFAALLLYSCLPINPNPNPNLKPNSVSNPWGKATFLIKVLAYNRLIPLQRCLRSLAAADYLGDRVDLHIHLDHFEPTDADSSSLKQQIHEFVDRFEWPYGEKIVHYRKKNAGLQAQWIESWWPGSDDEFAFVVEDDLEVSPFFFKHLKSIILKYYYDKSNYSPYIFGASLQRPRFVAGKHGNKIQLGNETLTFSYQIPGTWGQLLFPKPWREFRIWYNEMKKRGIKPILQGMITTDWYKRKGEKIWTPWFIKFIHIMGYFNIFTHFPDEMALSVSHRDAGVNYRKNVGPDSNLIMKIPDKFNLNEFPDLRDLQWRDFCFRQVFPDRVVKRLDDLGTILKSMHKGRTVILISLYRIEKKIVRNLICHFEKVGVANYIFVSDDSEFLNELSRRGHPVIDSTQLVRNAGTDLIKEVLVKARLVQNILDLGYNLWYMEGNMVPFGGVLSEPSDRSHDMFISEDLEFMFVRNSQISKKLLDNSAVRNLLDSRKSSRDSYFVRVIARVVGSSSGVKIWGFEEWSLNLKLGGFEKDHENSTSILKGGEKSLVYWAQNLRLNSVQRELESIDLWLIDEDSACTAVFCQPQKYT